MTFAALWGIRLRRLQKSEAWRTAGRRKSARRAALGPHAKRRLRPVALRGTAGKKLARLGCGCGRALKARRAPGSEASGSPKNCIRRDCLAEDAGPGAQAKHPFRLAATASQARRREIPSGKPAGRPEKCARKDARTAEHPQRPIFASGL